uniref:L-threonylcarbamoyladenylate synthase n=1 Tax=candidate division WOR-3 bacterium TaxID=2052148 RepID=A0A7C4GGX0_UNCW3
MGEVLTANVDSAARAARVIESGGVVIFPTETVYGIGADIANPTAVRRLFEVKGRDFRQPLMAHCSSLDQLAGIVCEVPVPARRLIHRFWPGPLALVLPRSPAIADVVVGGLDTIGVRMVADSFTCLLIENLGRPIAGSSANRSGRPATGSFSELDPGVIGDVDVAIDAGAAGSGQPSTVLDMAVSPPRVIRSGAVAVAEIEAVLGFPVRQG